MERLRVTYSKSKEAIYLSHLDTLKVFNEALIRANISVEYSKGYNPRPEITFAHPLSVGIESTGEIMEIILSEYIETPYFIKQMNKALPDGITILAAEYVELNQKSIMSRVYASTYLITFIYGEERLEGKTKKQIEDTLPKKIKKQCSIDIEITTRMEQIKELLNADRVQIYDFHNGGHYANGRSALKTSCTYEVCRTGCKSYQMLLQSIPLTCIPQFIRSLLDKSELKVNDLESIKNSMPATYQLKKGQGIKAFYDIILNNKQNEPIGFLAIQYSEINTVNFSQYENNEILRLKFFIEENLEKMVAKK